MPFYNTQYIIKIFLIVGFGGLDSARLILYCGGALKKSVYLTLIINDESKNSR